VGGGTVQGGALYSTGNLQVNGSSQVNGNSNTSGQVSAGGSVVAGGYVIVNGWASPGGACPGPQYIGAGPSGPLLCENGVWSTAGQMSASTYSLVQGTSGAYLGTHAFCAIGYLHGFPDGGTQNVYTDGSGNWWGTNVTFNGYGTDLSVNCLN
jgi:hypothetical protein